MLRWTRDVLSLKTSMNEYASFRFRCYEFRGVTSVHRLIGVISKDKNLTQIRSQQTGRCKKSFEPKHDRHARASIF